MSGVPQGPMLDPVLFLIYLNYVRDLLQGDVLLFADDVKLISAIASFPMISNTTGTGLLPGTFLLMRMSRVTSLSVLLQLVP